jgi:thymidylate synthase
MKNLGTDYKDELIKLLKDQVVQLSIMSKIELGDDVISEINRLRSNIKNESRVSIDQKYQDLLKDILENGVKKEDRTGTGTLSVFGRQIRHKMSEGFPLLTTKKMHWKSIVTELLWFLRGDTNIKYLVDNGCNIWNGDAYKRYCGNWKPIKEDCGGDLTPYTQEEFINKIKTDDMFAKKWGELGPIYGKQWRSWEHYEEIDQHYSSKTQKIEESDILRRKSIDQIQNLINDLKTNPDSRRLMVNSWNVSELDQMVLPPCHYGFQVYTRELSEGERSILYSKKMEGYVDTDDVKTTEHYDRMNIPKRAISLGWNQRSVDTFLGLPFNIASYGLLLEILAKIVNMVPDELIGNLGDVHLYSNHIEQAKEQITRTPYELPKIVHMKTDAFWNGFDISQFGHLDPTDFKVDNYQSHPSIKAPLSN